MDRQHGHGCMTLSPASQAGVSFGLNQADLGIPYRVRASYVRSIHDSSNLNNDSSWVYVLVET